MADIEKKQRELLLDLNEEMNWDSGIAECPGVDAMAMTEMPDYVKERLEELLADYINDDNNYVVEGAIVECDQMSKEMVEMYYRDGKLGIKGEGGYAETKYDAHHISLPRFELNTNEREIRAFHAINSKQEANGLRFATISDRSCLRDKIEKENMEEGKGVANLISMGNCKIMREADVLKIKYGEQMAKIYGTCYCLMEPDTQWVNPYCMESLVENNEKQANVNYCYLDAHHHTMNWDTDAGPEEGLTRLSTLLCTRGGIISFTWSGQSTQSTNADEILDDEEIVFIATVYGEVGGCSETAWKAVANVIMNRVGAYEWSEYRSITEIIEMSGFDAYGGNLYLEAEEYLNNRDYSNEEIERVIEAVMPIYREEEEDITNNAVFFFSPDTQKKLHEQNPSKYKYPPDCVNDKTEEVCVDGTENDDIKFYKFKD